MKKVLTIICCMMLLALTSAKGQVYIGGQVYGGGNKGNVNGSTSVTVKEGDINKVFGGARMANVGGNAYVNIDGKNATGYTVINYVFGGNDIAGSIGTAKAVGEELPEELEGNTDGVDKTWNTYVHLSTKLKDDDSGDAADDAKKIFIGQVFAGGNGDFDYEQTPGPGEGKVTHTIYNRSDKNHTTPLAVLVTDAGEVGFHMPDLDKAYLDIQGGTMFFAHGGGNNATVKEKTIIHVDNPSTVVTEIKVDENGIEDADGTDLLTANESSRVRNDMGIHLAKEHLESPDFQIGRLFGGNNKAEMSIRPKWNLQAGKIRNLYSGGNRGNMTSPEGLLLEINPLSTNKHPLIVDNVYGGCRMADVKPTVNGKYEAVKNLTRENYPDADLSHDYFFPNQLSARVLVSGGDINNVYGGNDVTGTVYGGNAIGIYTTIRGDVYGGGNGAYAYTDLYSLKDDEDYGDFYFDTPDGMDLFEALNAFRPNAEQVSIRLAGTRSKPTIIKGSVYVGGNCASLATKEEDDEKIPMVELKMGSFVVADKVFMGNNGERMIDPEILAKYNDENYFSGGLTAKEDFDEYMKGVTMNLQPSLVFDSEAKKDPATYEDYSSYVGSFYCGGNVGSMAIKGKNTYKIDRCLNIFEKFVGGCNSADVQASKYNPFYAGGILGSEDEQGAYTDDEGNIKDRLEINLDNLTITPLRWNDEFTMVPAGTTLTEGKTYYHRNLRNSSFVANGTEVAYDTEVDTDKHTYYELTKVGNYLEWNTAEWSISEGGFMRVENDKVSSKLESTRLLGGNVYGGCYNSGHVNGNVVVNINADLLKKEQVFGSCSDCGPFNRPASGVDFEKQRNDVMAVSMTLFGAGSGEETEIWGSTTVNHNKGYLFQIFGGGELGVVGKREYYDNGDPIVDDEGNYIHKFDKRYSTHVNLCGTETTTSDEDKVENLAETEFIYGGGNEGDVCGNTYVNLGKGRIYDAFGGASDADILGHVEVYIGRQPDGNGGYINAFPWIKDIVYGGNDFGGKIHGNFEKGFDFTQRIDSYDTKKEMLHGYTDGNVPDVLKGAVYVEYVQGKVDTIFGGCYGYYNYRNTDLYGDDILMPSVKSTFVNIRPNRNDDNLIKGVFGGGTGYPKNREGDASQDRSYVLIDIPDDVTKFAGMEVFGSGSYNGLGFRFTKTETYDVNFDPDSISAIIDLLHGQVKKVFGGSYNEGITRRTLINVPEHSTIKLNEIFGGAYGTQILPPCDVYESNINYSSDDAQVDTIYGGNNNERRTLYTKININSPVWSNKAKGWNATIFGAGKGMDTWSEHTQIHLNSGSQVYDVFGGGKMGHVLNSKSVQKYMQLYKNGPSLQIATDDPYWKVQPEADLWEDKTNRVVKAAYMDRWKEDWKDAWTMGDYYTPTETDGSGNLSYTDYADNQETNIYNESVEIVQDAEGIDDDKTAQLLGNTSKRYNTNVYIHQGATVNHYAYGGGLGDANKEHTGDVYGNTYIALLGGTVKFDIYAGGKAGSLDNLFSAEDFTPSANAYVKGGMVRNVFGGGYLGHVGHHEGDITASTTGDRMANTNVVIGSTDGYTFENGVPAITRNVYGAGEGGSVYGSAHVTINNGRIGYRYKNTALEGDPEYEYVEELDDAEPGDNQLDASGNIFGGGYVINSYVDNTNITLFNGIIRGSLYGGGEVGPVGRGTMKDITKPDYALKNGNATIVKAGQTHINMYGGHVLRNVFGGGRGKDSWGGDGTMYMDKALVATLDLKCKGYVFGQTDVNIFGGEIGTEEGMAYNFGNVFGGCDEGMVYSALMDGDNLLIGKKDGVRYNKGLTSSDPSWNYQGYYYKWNGTAFLTHDDGERYFTEDCHVLVEPHCMAKASVTIGTGDDKETYDAGSYVPTSALNKLKNKTQDVGVWKNLDDFGIIIHNAVFAGGNIAAGSSSMIANENTVFGNATASIHDIYNRDLITIGTGYTGGLYGDGNLTLVDGYRELNITNYGTDYYHLTSPLTYEQYEVLPAREQIYYEVKYKCEKTCTDIEGTTYLAGSNLPWDELVALFQDESGNPVKVDADGKRAKDGTGTAVISKDSNGKWVPNEAYWKQNGVVSAYAGRIMNTIQRADFCGVFGSRMVMKGAHDRVTDHTVATNYTINRVREVSLNKMVSEAGDTGDNALHGNYFGIYKFVNYLGALTSDVDFHTTVRTTKADPARTDLTPDGKTFEAWKEAHVTDKLRNNGSCYNQVALASGVHLEITGEQSTGTGLYEKEWGPITGVIELDLINVQPGIGGGFVYARNEHGIHSTSGIKTTTLTKLNEGAKTQWDFKYDGYFTNENEKESDGDDHKKKWETSGNFIHSTQTIIDDCYNISNRYKSKYAAPDGVPAHYWYIAGSVYVYDQYITAYTGMPNAFSEQVDIPITITAASNGKMTLMDVQPNLYAYYSSENTPLTADSKLVINDITYQLNDPITYWDWYKLPAAAKKLFVEKTYVTTTECKIGDTVYPAGYVMLPGSEENPAVGTYNYIRNHAPLGKLQDTDTQEVKYVLNANDKRVDFDDVFHVSNNLNHGTGYILTYNINNPDLWNKWFTEKMDSEHDAEKKREKNQTGGSDYEDGPTYHLKGTDGKLLGQEEYVVNDIISKEIYKNYAGVDENNDGVIEGDEQGLTQTHPTVIKALQNQAKFEAAYIVTSDYIDATHHFYKGAPIPYSIANSLPISKTEAYVCTKTIAFSENDLVAINELLTAADIAALKSAHPGEDDIKMIDELIKPAYYCTQAGLYGGNYYESGKNYRGLAAWSAMSETDRTNFEFNYDALDLLIDDTYGKTGDNRQKEGTKYQYDSKTATYDAALANQAHYSLPTAIDYTATYNGESLATSEITVKRYNKTEKEYENVSVTTVIKDDELTRETYESLPNERRHYAPIDVKADDVAGDKKKTVYVVHESFVHGKTPYAVGAVIDQDTYDRLNDVEKNPETGYITTLEFTSADMDKDGETIKDSHFYYCRESYKVGEKGDGKKVTSVKGVSYDVGATVPVGIVIKSSEYEPLVNKQTNFIIHGASPTETSTLYVARDANINDLSTERVITVIYKYDYEESDVDGVHITPMSERHVLNIHITFKSGVPIVEDILPPTIVLPGTGITMRVPNTTPGAYEILGGGWELFETESDAESHINGVNYTPIYDPLYWYQDGYQIAYYAKTYLGKTYSNHVPVSVANYHDLKEVMDDKTKHLNVDYDRTRLKRDAKVYINDYTGGDPAVTPNGLDLLKDFFDMSLLTPSESDLDGDGLYKTGRFEGHKPLNNSTSKGHNKYYPEEEDTKGVRGGMNLQFFLRTNIDHSKESWTSIGTDDDCFHGIFHGDGHTISGLSSSLFKNLCGDVYNVGIMGSFNTAGVADKGIDGYVESAWVKTTADTPLSSKPYAVFGNPQDNEGFQVVNSYFWNGNKNLFNNIEGDNPEILDYKENITSGGDRGKATAKSDTAFYNGELAYDLNNFYLYKRYSDKKTTSGSDNQKYWYLTIGDDDKPVIQKDHYYNSEASLCSSGAGDTYVQKYVEDRFADGDYRYAAGEIPTSEDERYYVETEKDAVTGDVTVLNSGFYPIWPDDYIFFGQKLTYGYSLTQAHQDVPTAVVRAGGRLADDETANRVYRAPAYFRSMDMGVAHFNPDVYLAQKSADGTKKAYPGMTAIDFAGHEQGHDKSAYELGLQNGLFYSPLLDDDGLTSIQNCDETRNLLVYAPAETAVSGYANKKTYDVLNNYFIDPIYNNYYDNTHDYRLVAENDMPVLGHIVQSDLKATNDHLLVDKQDFNCPIAYSFDNLHRMWYQRKPADAEYVDRTKGWQGISIPFTAELVTTHQKGEITHFYSGSEVSKNNTSTKIGHEYWLREFNAIKEEGTAPDIVAKADFLYPTAIGAAKEVTNTFLWDYYYKNENRHNQIDQNNDNYLEYRQYYEKAHTYSSYPLLSAAKPYILGLPGQTYYEFDLSGNFEASTTATPHPDKLQKQVITFASNVGETINISDKETSSVTHNGYTFKSSYLNEELANGNYVMNSDGNAYVQLNDAGTGTYHTTGSTYANEDAFEAAGQLYSDADGVTEANTYADASTVYYSRVSEITKNETNNVTPSLCAFRPYFIKEGSGSRSTRSIVFDSTNDEFGEDFEEKESGDGVLTISSRPRHIIVTSTLKAPRKVTIHNAAGIRITTFVINPGQTIETLINMPGFYVVNKTKIAVR